MKSFDEYTTRAINRYGLRGQNALAREIGIAGATLSQFSSGKALPSEQTMIKLAELAGLPKEEALIDLNLWRSKDKPEVQKIWQRLAKMIGCAAGFLVLSSFDANACNFIINSPADDTAFECGNIYYATNCCRRNMALSSQNGCGFAA